jgi:hypothetical protein
MFLMDQRALGTFFVCAPKRRSKRHSNRDPGAEPHRNMPGKNPGDRAQGRS